MADKQLELFLDYYLRVFGIEDLKSHIYDRIGDHLKETFMEAVKSEINKFQNKIEVLFLSDSSYFPIVGGDEGKRNELMQRMNFFSNLDFTDRPLIFFCFGMKKFNLIKTGANLEIVTPVCFIYQQKEFFKIDSSMGITIFSDINLFFQEINKFTNQIPKMFKNNVFFSTALFTTPSGSKSIPPNKERDNIVQLFGNKSSEVVVPLRKAA